MIGNHWQNTVLLGRVRSCTVVAFCRQLNMAWQKRNLCYRIWGSWKLTLLEGILSNRKRKKSHYTYYVMSPYKRSSCVKWNVFSFERVTHWILIWHRTVTQCNSSHLISWIKEAVWHSYRESTQKGNESSLKTHYFMSSHKKGNGNKIFSCL